MNVAKLSDMRVGESGQVLSLRCCDKAYRQKLMAMGLTRGTQFRVMRVAPFGDPFEIEVRGFALSLRKDEAESLQIQRVSS